MPSPTAGVADIVAVPSPTASEAVQVPRCAIVDAICVGVVACQMASARAAQALNANVAGLNVLTGRHVVPSDVPRLLVAVVRVRAMADLGLCVTSERQSRGKGGGECDDGAVHVGVLAGAMALSVASVAGEMQVPPHSRRNSAAAAVADLMHDPAVSPRVVHRGNVRLHLM